MFCGKVIKSLSTFPLCGSRVAVLKNPRVSGSPEEFWWGPCSLALYLLCAAQVHHEASAFFGNTYLPTCSAPLPPRCRTNADHLPRMIDVIYCANHRRLRGRLLPPLAGWWGQSSWFIRWGDKKLELLHKQVSFLIPLLTGQNIVCFRDRLGKLENCIAKLIFNLSCVIWSIFLHVQARGTVESGSSPLTYFLSLKGIV